MQQLAQNNLFTAFNNIEKIKEERKVKPVIRVEEMIKKIKEHYNLNAPMLAHNLGVDVQAIYRWEKGGRPNIKRYNKIKELYEEIIRENKTEALEQPETALKPLEIADKEVIEDVTVGTPFIKLSKFNVNYVNNLEPFYVNIHEIVEILNKDLGGSLIRFCNESVEFRTTVEETPEEIFELIRKKIKENEKN
nr:MAG TPA: antitoxin [Caudoviricetes sp.]DAS55841.1 MAG TPA: antitoxin [Caudoviricetes sp.]